jgi:hypothetical protein
VADSCSGSAKPNESAPAHTSLEIGYTNQRDAIWQVVWLVLGLLKGVPP